VLFRPIQPSVADGHKELAREAARQIIVLLENRKSTLPLKRSDFTSAEAEAGQLTGLKVALVGPCANNTNCHIGDYTPKNDGPIITPLEALRQRIGAASVLYAPGCPADIGCNGGPCAVSCRCVNQSRFAPAIAAVKSADVVVFIGGSSALAEWMEGEAADKGNLAWPGQQEALAKALKAAAGFKPFIVAMAHGSPLVSEWAFSTADAVLNIGYGGQAAGLGFVDVLFGEPEGPSGKLTVTYYKKEQLGDFMSYNMTGSLGPKGKTYRYLTSTPYYRFGHGMTYTSFTYSKLVVAPRVSSDPCASTVVTVLVTNSGGAKGAEIAQLYMSFANASVPTPPIKLVGFSRTPTLAPGESAPLSFIVSAEHRAIVLDYDFSQALEAGTFKLNVGGRLPQGAADEGVLRGSFENRGEGPLKRCSSA